ncbi:MAG TPA: hypothetical protein VLE89_02695 [Chlamydiales bacterium]|nr:hypothetical protein [Chlamydiales bacterium]
MANLNLYSTRPGEGYSHCLGVSLSQEHQKALDELLTHPTLTHFIEDLKRNFPEFKDINPSNPLFKLSSEPDSIRIYIKPSPFLEGKKVPLTDSSTHIHDLASYIMGESNIRPLQPAPVKTEPQPTDIPQTISLTPEKESPDPVLIRQLEEERKQNQEQIALIKNLSADRDAMRSDNQENQRKFHEELQANQQERQNLHTLLAQQSGNYQQALAQMRNDYQAALNALAQRQAQMIDQLRADHQAALQRQEPAPAAPRNEAPAPAAARNDAPAPQAPNPPPIDLAPYENTIQDLRTETTALREQYTTLHQQNLADRRNLQQRFEESEQRSEQLRQQLQEAQERALKQPHDDANPLHAVSPVDEENNQLDELENSLEELLETQNQLRALMEQNESMADELAQLRLQAQQTHVIHQKAELTREEIAAQRVLTNNATDIRDLLRTLPVNENERKHFSDLISCNKRLSRIQGILKQSHSINLSMANQPNVIIDHTQTPKYPFETLLKEGICQKIWRASAEELISPNPNERQYPSLQFLSALGKVLLTDPKLVESRKFANSVNQDDALSEHITKETTSRENEIAALAILALLSLEEGALETKIRILLEQKDNGSLGPQQLIRNDMLSELQFVQYITANQKGPAYQKAQKALDVLSLI